MPQYRKYINIQLTWNSSMYQEDLHNSAVSAFKQNITFLYKQPISLLIFVYKQLQYLFIIQYIIHEK